MADIITKIREHLAHPLTESVHGDVLQSVLKKHGLQNIGINANRAVKELADRHDIHPKLIPAVVDHALNREKYYDNVQGHNDITDYIKNAGSSDAHRYRGFHTFNSAVDNIQGFHELATHPHREKLLHSVLDKRDAEYPVEQEVDEFMDHIDRSGEEERPRHEVHRMVQSRRNFHDWKELQGAKKMLDDFNPTSIKTYPDGEKHIYFRTLVGAAISKLNDEKEGDKAPPYKPDATHTHNGVTYHGYTLDTPEKANAGCWGERYCIATSGKADDMNRMYHGGTYQPAHIIMKSTGPKRSVVHAAYLPGILPGTEHARPDQAVRNSGNNGPITGEPFKAIYPLLHKLDPAIADVKHYYEPKQDHAVAQPD